MKLAEQTTVTFRLPTELVDALKEKALKEDRSLTNMVKILLNEVVKT